jgi:molecular chaperone DnaK
MARTTIDFGIDLGTTNSEIALLKGTQVEVIKNNKSEEYTPSVVWISANRTIVGKPAKERYFSDPDNAAGEFKLRMGTSEEFLFKQSGRRLKPEELSAEILKSLKDNVRQRIAEEVEAAVITVPADFDLPQNAATSKAAQLAGFTQSPLLQEPVAAALTYGFQSKDDKVFWLVYDFGGGTFDAALIQLKDGQIEVVNHGGDKQLGGKLVDWEIVDQILAPQVAKQHGIADFRRGNPKWIQAFAKLKLKAEEAKITLSNEETADIYIDPLCKDAQDRDVSLEQEVRRNDVLPLLDPYIERSINICKKVLEEARLKAGSVEKLILVGGPTLTPYLRERLADKKRGLGIPLEFSVDPLTIVARGAAIFAGTQVLKRSAPAPVGAKELSLELVYDPISNDPEPPISGKILNPPPQGVAGYAIEFVNPDAKPAWRSGRVAVGPNGAFLATLWVEEGRQNTFQIELFDATGSRRETDPRQLSVTPGVRPTAAPLTHSVGVAMANGETDFFIQKNTPLPAQRRQVHRTAIAVRRGDRAEAIHIPVVEGQSAKADRNRLIGTLVISAADVRRDLPANSEVEITIKIDPSRLVTSKAYIPFLDQEFEQVLSLKREEVTSDQLKTDVDFVKARLGKLRKTLEAHEEATEPGPEVAKARQVLERISAERMEHDVDNTYRAAGTDPDAADKCRQRVQDLNLALDELEDTLQWPELRADFDGYCKFLREIVQQFGKGNDKARAAALERDCRQALDARDAKAVKAKLRELVGLGHEIWGRDPSYYVDWLKDLEEKRDLMRDPALADRLLNRGRVAIQDNDLAGLKEALRELNQLLPPAQQQTFRYKGTTLK